MVQLINGSLFCVSISLLYFALIQPGTEAADCIPRNFGESSFVCVCNATYCDTVPRVDAPLSAGRAIVISSTLSRARFEQTNLQFSPTSTKRAAITDEVTVDASIRYQSIIGFGGAFTDSAGINLAKLSRPAQDLLLRSYFSTDGIEYGVGRVPIGGTDFSTLPYTYLDDYPGDAALENFSLTEFDTIYKIPYIQQAKSMSSKPIKLFSSPWSAPAWMKSNNQIYGGGVLLEEYYQPWAEYFVKFFEEYAINGITFWGVTAQNEPVAGNIPNYQWNCMGWTAETQATFVGQNLGPTMVSKGFGDIKIMIDDEQRYTLPDWPRTVLSDPVARQYISGIAVHWYANFYTPPDGLTETHNEFPDFFLLSTEACDGFVPGEPDVVLGSWERLERYSANIIEDLNHFVTGWVDWNLALDLEGGPNWSGNLVDAPIIVNETSNEFYKQPMYYAMGHFSKYIPEESVRIGLQMMDELRLTGTAFLRPDGKRVVVLLNRSDEDKVILIKDADRGSLELDCPARSIHTVVYG